MRGTFASATAAAVGVATLAIVAGCVDPLLPGGAVPTLDDAATGDFVAVTVGEEHSCALTSAGVAFCWGSDEFGQLGVGGGTATCLKVDRHVPCERSPRAVAGSLTFKRIAAGSEHTCAIAIDDRVYCWGDNLRGQLGDPAIRASNIPAPILSNSLFFDIAAGDLHTCALRTDALAVCWGANDQGQLGIALLGPGSASPAPVQSTLRFASIAAGNSRTCARQPDGTVYCWGSHWVGRGTDGVEITRPQAQPIRLIQAPAVQELSVGGQTTCAVGVDAVAYCWEANPMGTFGDGSTIGSTAPRAVASSEHFANVAAGLSHTCALADTGDVYCWGDDTWGQLGVSSAAISRRCGFPAVPCVVSPNRVTGWRKFARIAAGLGGHVCGVTITQSVYCWGAGSLGQRGDGRSRTDWVPVRAATP